MAILGLITGGTDFSGRYFVLKSDVPEGASLQAAKDSGAAVFAFGAFMSAILNFLIIAFVVFLLVQVVNRIKDAAMKKRSPPPRKRRPSPRPRRCWPRSATCWPTAAKPSPSREGPPRWRAFLHGAALILRIGVRTERKGDGCTRLVMALGRSVRQFAEQRHGARPCAGAAYGDLDALGRGRVCRAAARSRRYRPG